MDCCNGSNYVFALRGFLGEKYVRYRATALMSPLPVATTKFSEHDRMRWGTGRRKIQYMELEPTVCGELCDAIFVSCGPWCTTKYLSNKDTQMCTETHTHVWLTAGIILKNNNSETGSWICLLKLKSTLCYLSAPRTSEVRGSKVFPDSLSVPLASQNQALTQRALQGFSSVVAV